VYALKPNMTAGFERRPASECCTGDVTTTPACRPGTPKPAGAFAWKPGNVSRGGQQFVFAINVPRGELGANRASSSDPLDLQNGVELDNIACGAVRSMSAIEEPDAGDPRLPGSNGHGEQRLRGFESFWRSGE
jgi:hypothetical protein